MKEKSTRLSMFTNIRMVKRSWLIKNMENLNTISFVKTVKCNIEIYLIQQEKLNP